MLGKVESGAGKSPSFRFSLIIGRDFTWKLHVLGVPAPSCNICANTPDKLTTLSEVQDLLIKVDNCSVCTGNTDNRFVEMMKRRKGVIMGRTGDF